MVRQVMSDRQAGQYLAVLAHQLMLFHLQHVMMADELRLQSSKGFPCLASLL